MNLWWLDRFLSPSIATSHLYKCVCVWVGVGVFCVCATENYNATIVQCTYFQSQTNVFQSQSAVQPPLGSGLWQCTWLQFTFPIMATFNYRPWHSSSLPWVSCSSQCKCRLCWCSKTRLVEAAGSHWTWHHECPCMTDLHTPQLSPARAGACKQGEISRTTRLK